LENTREEVEKYHKENPDMPGPNLADYYEKGFPQVDK